MLDEKTNLLAAAASVSEMKARRDQLHSTPVGQQLKRRWVQLRPTLASLFVGAMVWEVAGRWLDFRFLPPLSGVMMAAAAMIANGQILLYLAASIVSLIAGYSLAVVGGVLLGTVMGRYRVVEYLVDPYLNAFIATPKLVLVPVLYALFGVSRLVQVVFVFISAFFDVVLNTMRGIQTVDPAYIEMARAFGAKENQLFWKILLPGALPMMMAGLRLAMGRAIKGMVKGEMVISIFGLGALLRTYGARFDAEKVFAVLLFVIGIALVFTAGVQFIERRVTRWTDPKL